MPMTIGTTGTFCFVQTDAHIHLYLTYRVDIGIHTIPSTFCNALIYILRGMKNDENAQFDVWRLRQRNVDFLSTRTFLARYISQLGGDASTTLPTLEQLSYDQTKLTMKFIRHYEALGYPMSPLVYEKDDTVWVGDVAITDIQALPKKVLLYLITHRGRMVTFDELADVYWGASSDQSSLYTMAKAIQKIHDAFKAHGIHQEIIKTVRKQGYILL